MPSTFAASVRNWTAKAKRNAKLVIAEASENVYMSMTTMQAGVKETGGSFEIGKVPVDWGYLVGSTEVSLNGVVMSTGSQGQPADFTGVVLGMQLGDPIEAVFTAEYGPHVEYGTENMQGRFFVRQAVAQWPAFIAAAAAKY